MNPEDWFSTITQPYGGGGGYNPGGALQYAGSYNPADDPNSPERQSQLAGDPEGYYDWLLVHNANSGRGGGGGGGRVRQVQDHRCGRGRPAPSFGGSPPFTSGGDCRIFRL